MTLPPRLIVATSNTGKLREFRDLFADVSVTLEGLDAHPGVTMPEETGSTYQANAILKAEAIALATGHAALGDDSGLEVAPLDGRPGLYSARFEPKRLAGESQDAANRRKLLAELQATHSDPSTWHAAFVCALAIAMPGQPTKVFMGRAEGLVLPSPRGDGGFGYDPLLFLLSHNRTMAEIDEREKNRISHRGQAVTLLLRDLL